MERDHWDKLRSETQARRETAKRPGRSSVPAVDGATSGAPRPCRDRRARARSSNHPNGAKTDLPQPRRRPTEPMPSAPLPFASERRRWPTPACPHNLQCRGAVQGPAGGYALARAGHAPPGPPRTTTAAHRHAAVIPTWDSLWRRWRHVAERHPTRSSRRETGDPSRGEVPLFEVSSTPAPRSRAGIAALSPPTQHPHPSRPPSPAVPAADPQLRFPVEQLWRRPHRPRCRPPLWRGWVVGRGLG